MKETGIVTSVCMLKRFVGAPLLFVSMKLTSSDLLFRMKW
ncbi:hypothetical protein BSNT_08749 [Bacillus subtilis subsp. natto BEST195]|nr:hypothetical protein BSNT_08749 [Bacillus subtilis subsp. natto BEST195]